MFLFTHLRVPRQKETNNAILEINFASNKLAQTAAFVFYFKKYSNDGYLLQFLLASDKHILNGKLHVMKLSSHAKFNPSFAFKSQTKTKERYTWQRAQNIHA